MAVSATSTPAQESWHAKTTFEPARESWVGAELFRDVLSIYAGATYAPFGNLRRDGLRLRVVGGQSRYTYEGRRFDPVAGNARTVRFDGQAHFVDALAGYQWSRGDLTLKLFAGIAIADHVIAPFDTETVVQGKSRGAKGAIEAWYNLSTTGYVALDFGVAEAHRTYSTRIRLGLRGGHGWSAGPEVQRQGHIEGDSTRLGVFVRNENDRHELSLAVGVHEPDDSRGSVYVTGQWLSRF